MPKKKPYARIAITLPQEVLAAADRLAKQLDRSRSWVIAEALRQYAAGGGRAAPGTHRVREAPTAPYGWGTGLGESRLAQLQADLELTPEERVKAAEDTARTTSRPGGAAAGRLLLFDRYEDYLEWKKRDAIGLE